MEGFYALKLRPMWEFFKKEHFSFWMICGYLFVEYVRPQSIFPAIDFLPWAQLFLLGALLGWSFDARAKWVAATANKWMVLFLLVIILSILMAQYPEVSRKHFSDFFSWFIVYFAVILNVTNRKRFYIFLLIFLFASFKISFSLARVWALRGFSFSSWGLQGPPGYFTNSGELSIQMLVFAPVAYHLYITIKPHLVRWKRFMMLLMPVTAAMTVVGASSRGAQIGLLYQIYALFLKGRLSFKSIVVTVGIVGLIYYAIPDAQKQRFQNTGKDKTSEQRLLYWKRGVEMIQEYPVLGVGYFNFIPYFEEHYSSDLLFEKAQLPHNIFIQIGTDAGLLGLSVYVTLIGQIFLANRRARRYAAELGEEGQFFTNISRGLDTGTWGFLIAGFFVTVGYYPFIWINLALSTALQHIAGAELRKKQDSNEVAY